jgi:RNA polymerase sigma-70 factor, ECF subfamily
MAQQDSDRLRYEQWVKLYAPALYRYAYRMTGRPQIAEDLLQETFMEAWRCVAKQGGDERARGWLFQILRHRCAHFFRTNRRQRPSVSLSEGSHGDPPDSAQSPLDRLGNQDALQTALAGLSEPMRQTFLMVFVEGRTCREAAEMQHIPIGTILSRLHTARQTLRGALADLRPMRDGTPAGNVEGTKTIS